MKAQALIQHQSNGASKPHLHVVPRKEHLSEREAEERIQYLTNRLENIHAASHLVLLKSGTCVYDPKLDLRVKVEAVRWMLRIAKHMAQSSREVVFLRIDSSLRQLEIAIETQIRALESGSRIDPFVVHSSPASNAC